MTDTPRVAFVVKMFPRFSETFTLNELFELERRGCALTVYSLGRPFLGPVHPDLARLHARVVVLPDRPLHAFTGGARDAVAALAAAPRITLRTLAYVLTRGSRQAWKRFFQAATLAADLRRHPVDRIHAQFASAPSRVARFASRLSGVPFSLTPLAEDLYPTGSDPDQVRARIAAAEFATTVSDYTHDPIAGLMNDAGRVGRMHDLSRVTRAPRSREPVVLAAGRLEDRRGFDVLLEAWPQVRAACPDARLVIVGTGPEERGLRALARTLGLSGDVYWAGAEPSDGVGEWLAMARAFCLPSRAAKDGVPDAVPGVLLEALGAGVPCVSTALAGVAAVVRDGREGLLVESEDRDALARALIALLRDPFRCEVMGRQARARAEEYLDLRRNAAELADWFGGRP